MREHYSFITCNEEVDLLNSVLGCSISMLSANSLEIKNNIISSHYFAFQINSECWLNVSSDWGDTPKTYLDFWFFEIVIADHPTGLMKKSQNGKNIASKYCSNIFLNNPIDEVIKISIYSYGDRNSDESVYCDRAIGFLGKNGESFILTTPDGIIGWMQLITEQSAQEKILSTFQLRKELFHHEP